ncbi:MAG: phosphoribosyltransferase family protein [Eubacteriales bacterium]|nr:phosphoribosyltransferase family protein [Eubacteriales bacterium]
MGIFSPLLDLLFPPKCVFCHCVLGDDETEVCEKCAASVMISTGSYSARNMDSAVSFCYAPLTYEGNVKESLHRFKFGGNSFYADTYADTICSTLNWDQIVCDVITWVPLSRARLRKRGYDQAGLIAQKIAENRGIPCVRTLKKTKNVKPQSSIKDPDARKKNISGVYTAVNPEFIKGKRILLVDDIVTTGATVSECAETLFEAGAASVGVVAAAHD